MGQLSLFAQGPPGFAFGENLFSPEEESRFAALFATLPLRPFEFHGHLGNRRIVSYGWRYDYSGRKLRESEPMPDFLGPLKQVAARFSHIPAPDFQHGLVTEYAPGAGIGWHRDKPIFQDVVALSFLAPCRLRFRRRRGEGWERMAVEVTPRSGYLLRGAAREEWEHSIPPVDALRYSVTFRNFRS
ncbi:MAG: alpha-ketoglutarate-dependent dioxygenase AlkB [Alphaproteobacteria bacterium]|nr:alpha-ketoglutarate-dependent dioxygenase AlkB [Alphaproteobacteria bacterium]